MLKIIKIGGKLIEDAELLSKLCDSLVKFYPNFVLVHGGGSMAAELAGSLGVETRMHEGRRITDAKTLEIATMTYAGLANKRLVAALQVRGVNACGLSGCDMNVVVSHKREVKDIDWGYVGDVDAVGTKAIGMLLDAGVVPVISPITFSLQDGLLNTNADSVASAVAVAMSKQRQTECIFCFDKPGVLLDVNDNNSLIPQINRETYARLSAEKKIFSGMLPKLDNAFKMIGSGVERVRLTNPDNLDSGTVIIK